MNSRDAPPRRPRLDRQGRTLVALSSIAPAVLFLSALLVAWIGSEYFRTRVPDPLGWAATRFASSTLCFTLTGVAAVFMMFAYTWWYRAALLDRQPTEEIGAHWAGMILILVGIPYFVFGLLYGDEYGGKLLLWGALLAFTVGAVFFFSHVLWPHVEGSSLAPRDTR